MAQDAEGMLLPLFDMQEYDYFAKETRGSRDASYKYAKLLFALGCSGKPDHRCGLLVNVNELNRLCKELKVTNISRHLTILENYGFTAEGLETERIKMIGTLQLLETGLTLFPTYINRNRTNYQHSIYIRNFSAGIIFSAGRPGMKARK